MIFNPERLHQLFEYLPETGQLRSRTEKKNRPTGTIVGFLNNSYFKTTVDGKRTTVHQIVWQMHHGSVPIGYVIDHIDHNPQNNRIENLRLLTPSQNIKHRRARKISHIVSPHPGVWWNSYAEAWRVTITVEGKKRYVGQSIDLDRAIHLCQEAHNRPSGTILVGPTLREEVSMGTFVDFAAVREGVSLTQAMQHLGLKLKKEGDAFRGPCPACRKGGDRALAVTPGKGFYCFGTKKGGNDSTSLVAHVKGISQREAGAELQEQFLGADTSSTAGSTATGSHSHSTPRDNPPPTDGMQPLAHLSTDHPAIEALGLTVPVCEALGIGFANKGVMRGRIAFPLRLPDGTLIGYQGLATSPDQAPLLLFPSNLAEKVAAPPAQEEKPTAQIVDFKQFYRSAS